MAKAHRFSTFTRDFFSKRGTRCVYFRWLSARRDSPLGEKLPVRESLGESPKLVFGFLFALS